MGRVRIDGWGCGYGRGERSCSSGGGDAVDGRAGDGGWFLDLVDFDGSSGNGCHDDGVPWWDVWNWMGGFGENGNLNQSKKK